MISRIGALVLAMAPVALLVPAGPAKKAAPAIRPLETFVNSNGMRLALVPAGDFLMGSPESDKDALADEKPQHKVRITKIYGVGLTHVTVGDFRRFVQATKYKTAAEQQGSAWRAIRSDGKLVVGDKCDWQNPGFPITAEHPVVNVDYDYAIAYCDWLTKTEGHTYRLPTEAEWEYCCRATTTTRWNCGDDPDELVDYARIHLDHFPKYARQNGPIAQKLGWLFFCPVAQHKANPWGLYDMHGNLWQWTSDWYAGDYYKEFAKDSVAEDPVGPKEGGCRVIRGGTWSRGPLDCRSANRFGLSGATSLWVGFRVVCERPLAKK